MKKYLIVGLVLAIGFFTNPSLPDFKSEAKSAFDNLDGQSEAAIKVLMYAGKFQICRKNFGLFSVYRCSYKTPLTSDEDPKFYLGTCGSFLPIEANAFTKGSYSSCLNVKTSDLK
jgi:hypothetical protein